MNTDLLPFAPAGAVDAAPFDRGSYRRTLRDYQALDRALSAGDIDAARAAFARLQEDSPPLAEALSHHPFPDDPFHLRALKELGHALLTGDLDGAKLAFLRFQ